MADIADYVETGKGFCSDQFCLSECDNIQEYLCCIDFETDKEKQCEKCVVRSKSIVRNTQYNDHMTPIIN